ncbi:MAG: hypothetical protein ABIW85_08015 [Variovorax sp.]
MDFLLGNWLLVVAVLAVLVMVYVRSHRRSPAARRRSGHLSAVESVRLRQELSSQLQDLAGETAPALLQAEAKRLRATEGSIRALEAALERAKSRTDSAKEPGNRQS